MIISHLHKHTFGRSVSVLMYLLLNKYVFTYYTLELGAPWDNYKNTVFTLVVNTF